MDWTVELHPEGGGDVTMTDLPDFEAVLTYIKDHKAKDSDILHVHARTQPSDEQRAAVISAGGMPMWSDHGLGGSN